MLEQLKSALQTAQTEQAQADIALMEATARAETARGASSRLEAAVAALNGEIVPAEPPAPPLKPDNSNLTEIADHHIVKAHTDIQDMTPEEFDAHRVENARKNRQKQKELEKEAAANNPLAHFKCTGCGREGTTQETIIQAPSGAPVRMLVCYKCNNQTMS